MGENQTVTRSTMRTVLAVDDSRTNLSVLAGRLGKAGYLVVLSDTGADALHLISAGGIDLVLLDMVMPRVSGMEVLQEIRATRETMDLPVIMVTGRSDPTAAVEALSAGADDWIAKPFAFEVLEARIARLLARAARMAELKRANAALDARIAARAIELGEVRADLATSNADRARLMASIGALHEELARIEARRSGSCWPA